MTGNEIRETFLSYFERNGHTRVRSSPLLPANDPTLLFTNAGMNQFKDVFLGLEKRDYLRACSSQKCLRAGGKHNDLDEVGKTARHHTFFEMLGNFSFGDYFKREAIEYAWEFVTEVLGLDPQYLRVSVFREDDEARALWKEVAGLSDSRIYGLDEKDNFWQMADTGPCGPCSEIFIDLAHVTKDWRFPEGATGEWTELDREEFSREAFIIGSDAGRFLEFWNLVFMQFDRSADGTLIPLPKPSVDTGAGLERIAAIKQGVTSNYLTDLIRPIIDFTAELAGRRYEHDSNEGFAMRVIADHARATAFSIADGILPANEGRNYVLRKIMRRAIYQGRHVLFAQADGHEGLFFNQVVNFVIDQMKDAYPELETQRDFIVRMVTLEEQRFATALSVGIQKLDAFYASSRFNDGAKTADKTLTSEDWRELAVLYDTFGTPRDLIRVSLAEHGFAIDEEQFNQSFDAALQALQQTGTTEKAEGKAKTNPVYAEVVSRNERSQFKGYETTRVDDARVVAVLKGGSEVPELSAGDEGEVILDHTPFYAESGGQVGDVGRLSNLPAAAGGTDFIASVVDAYSPAQGLIVHKIKGEKGTLKVGDTVSAEVDAEKRDATRRNHTATHLMHAALREVLGTHVKQAGSVVAPNYLRFDFSHYQPLTKSEIEEIENLVNYHILRNEPVETNEMAIEEAMRSGAMALFGEKYGEKVRVLSIKGAEDIFSRELCGGTHVRATGDIGLFKIVSDESIASGVRRIRALTGVDAFERFREAEAIVDRVTSGLRTSRTELPAQVERLQEELKKARREADDLRMKIATGAAASSANGDESRDVGGVRVIAQEASGLDAAGMRQLSDTLLARIKSGVVVLGRTGDGKVSLIVRTSSDVSNRVPAGQVIKELAPIVGGRGGGKPDMAEGGGNQPEKLAEALEASFKVVERLLG
ncbi:MAG: alanine--tRNA ligase [Pyrinomonadaceae bacterium]|nr:alanine--tRNA ligase [Pyrinomonadaceae bacterium]